MEINRTGDIVLSYTMTRNGAKAGDHMAIDNALQNGFRVLDVWCNFGEDAVFVTVLLSSSPATSPYSQTAVSTPA